MKKTNFFKLLMVGAAALTIGLTGCNYASQADLDAACKDISALQTDLAGIKAQIEALGYVSKVQLKSGTTDQLEIFMNGGATPSATLTIQTAGGDDKGSVITKSDDGFWVFDGEKTVYPVAAGEVVGVYPPKLNPETLVWQFANEEGVYADSVYPATGAYYTVETDTAITLYIWSKEDKALKPIELAKYVPGGDIAKIDILGWINTADAAINGSGDLDMTKVDKTTAIAVKYAWIEKFVLDNDATANTTTVTPTSNFTDAKGADGQTGSYVWQGKTKVVVKNVLNTLVAEGTGIIIEVFPSNAPIDFDFILQDSKSGVLPLKMGTAVQISGYLTRAASNSGVWFIPFTYEDSSVTYGKLADYTDKFKPAAAVYTLVMPNGLRSEYTNFRINEAPASAVDEPKVEKIDGKTAGTNGFEVKANTEYDVAFTTATANNVVDYYFEVANDTNSYITNQFGIVIDKPAGTFKVTKVPDVLTLASFDLKVYKLTVDGKIYIETIEIYPVRDNQGEVIRSGDYAVTDEDNKPTPVASPTSGTADLSAAMTPELKPMFDKIAGIPSGSMTLKERWQSQQYGAVTVTLTSMSIGGKDLSGTTAGYKDPLGDAGATYQDNPTPAQWVTMFNAAGGVMRFIEKTSSPAAAVVIPDAATVTSAANLYQAQYFQMTPSYARTNNSDPMFEIGKEYVLNFDFSDDDGVYLSTAIVKFTPTIPTLASMFKKQNAFWNADQSVLNAYYPDPAAPWGTGADVTTTYDVAAGAAGNGGFETIGGTGKQWAEVQLGLDQKQADGTWVYAYWAGKGASIANSSIAYGLVTAEADADRKFTLLYQNTVDNGTLGYMAPLPAGGKDGYKVPMNVQVSAQYLGVYSYGTGDDRNTSADFKISMMSALFEGDIKAWDESAEAVAIEAPAAAGGATYKFGDDKIKGFTYNLAAPAYSLFQVDNGTVGSPVLAYTYTYIQKVEFSVPAAHANKYFIVNADASDLAFNKAVPPTRTGTGAGTHVDSYVNIKPGNITTGETVQITVKVTDRFGKSKSKDLNLKLVTQ